MTTTSLSINIKKKYIPVEYSSTTEIMAYLQKIEMEITKGLKKLEEMING